MRRINPRTVCIVYMCAFEFVREVELEWGNDVKGVGDCCCV